MPPILNIAGYRFVGLDNLPALRRQLFAACSRHGLRGTILLATEGINLFLAGAAESIARFRRELDADSRLVAMDFKESWSDEIPFRRLKVRIKDEIIALGRPEIDPARDPAPAIEPELLKSWLDTRRQVLLLDTRNGFEVENGTFAGAVHLGNDSFREFAIAARHLPHGGDDIAIVTFCTGGIRCEKAAPLLRGLGHRNVFQLSGGILRYFEKVGHDHYNGECFVFDERIAVDADLRPLVTQNPVQL
ncbi:MAG: rhodanese-like domain-containing protein [Casimicrobiaceae bacterium]